MIAPTNIMLKLLVILFVIKLHARINIFKKTPMIPPLLVNDKIISNFYEKANLFNRFFASQCTPLENNSSLPPLCLKTEKSLSSLKIRETDIFVITKKLHSNKLHD